MKTIDVIKQLNKLGHLVCTNGRGYYTSQWNGNLLYWTEDDGYSSTFETERAVDFGDHRVWKTLRQAIKKANES